MRTVRYGSPAWRALPGGAAARVAPSARGREGGGRDPARRAAGRRPTRSSGCTARFDGVRLPPVADPRAAVGAARAGPPRRPRARRARCARWPSASRRSTAGSSDAGFRAATCRTDRVLEEVVRPLDSAALYVPGGAGAYPSSVLMNAIPARVAGVPRVQVVTPPRALEASPGLAAALVIAGVERRVFRVGGAQAIAACAYGTKTRARRRQDRRARQRVRRGGEAAGARRASRSTRRRARARSRSWRTTRADPGFVAADLLAQAEHGSGDETVVLVTTVARRWRSEVARLVARGRALGRERRLRAPRARALRRGRAGARPGRRASRR